MLFLALLRFIRPSFLVYALLLSSLSLSPNLFSLFYIYIYFSLCYNLPLYFFQVYHPLTSFFSSSSSSICLSSLRSSLYFLPFVLSSTFSILFMHLLYSICLYFPTYRLSLSTLSSLSPLSLVYY